MLRPSICRLSVCNVCIVAKRCVLEQKLLLTSRIMRNRIGTKMNNHGLIHRSYRSTLSAAFSLCRMPRLDWYFVSADPTTSRTRSSAYIDYECRKGLCSRSQCRLPGTARWCPSVPAAVYTSRRHPVPTKTSVFHIGWSVRSCRQTAYCCRRRAFSVAGARVWNALPADVTSPPSLFTFQQESPAIADKPARRESLPKLAPIRRAYNVVADDTGLSSCV